MNIDRDVYIAQWRNGGFWRACLNDPLLRKYQHFLYWNVF